MVVDCDDMADDSTLIVENSDADEETEDMCGGNSSDSNAWAGENSELVDSNEFSDDENDVWDVGDGDHEDETCEELLEI